MKYRSDGCVLWKEVNETDMNQNRNVVFSFLGITAFAFFISSCSIHRQLERQAKTDFTATDFLKSANVGISIYDPETKKFLFDLNGEKYFIPASNTKLFSCYAAMKYLGDSLEGIRYYTKNDSLFLIPTGDPTFLHPDFTNQPVLKFLAEKKSYSAFIADNVMQTSGWGYGWSWDDYADYYMPERSALPVFGNVVRFRNYNNELHAMPFLPDWKIDLLKPGNFEIKRALSANIFNISDSLKGVLEVPYFTNNGKENIILLANELGIPIGTFSYAGHSSQSIYSQPTDSMLKMMMHRSDNFFAEQSLLMISAVFFTSMKERNVIDSLLHTDLKSLPQKPQWVDGSGLSRFNLFTPHDFVSLLEKMNSEFTWQRITGIFTTGGEGTLTRYKTFKGKLFAKTGTLSNNIALSGYIITNKNRKLIFSILIGNHTADETEIRSAMERFINTVIERY